MELKLESGKKIVDPTEDDIRQNLQTEGFAVLACDSERYIQYAVRKRLGGYWFEYQDGSIEQHYRAKDKGLTIQQVIEALCKYLRKDDSWRKDFQWEKMSFS